MLTHNYSKAYKSCGTVLVRCQPKDDAALIPLRLAVTLEWK
jgi:hypothetical protein